MKRPGYRLEAPIKEWPEGDRPREKLAAKGARFLTDTELLAILIGTGAGEKNAVDLARDMISRFGDLAGVEGASLAELTGLPGVGPAKAITIKAALELGRRFVGDKANRKVTTLSNAKEVARFYLPSLTNLKQEVFMVTLLNAKNRVIRSVTVSEGGLDATLARPRDVFAPAVREGAKGVILVHNHPSGDPNPSRSDINLTAQLKEAGELMGINVHDHVIIGDGEWFSFAESGLL